VVPTYGQEVEVDVDVESVPVCVCSWVCVHSPEELELELELELVSSSASVASSSVLPSVEVDVLVEHWSLPSASATQVFVSVVQIPLLQLVEVEVEVVPGSLANARPPPSATLSTRVSRTTTVLRSRIRGVVNRFIRSIPFALRREHWCGGGEPTICGNLPRYILLSCFCRNHGCGGLRVYDVAIMPLGAELRQRAVPDHSRHEGVGARCGATTKVGTIAPWAPRVPIQRAAQR